MADAGTAAGLHIARAAKRFLRSTECQSKSMFFKATTLGECWGIFLPPFQGHASSQNYGACTETSQIYGIYVYQVYWHVVSACIGR